MKYPSSLDIFCSVVDNFGDIGVCWRLARQMGVERGVKTRLFIDDIEGFYKFVPNPSAEIDIIHWTKTVPYPCAAEVVIEAFACTLPPHVISAMKISHSVWIDLEYLSAEDWVEGCHAIPSSHPSAGIKKTLFFPGFEARTGGLIRENDLIERRNGFQNDKNSQNLWRNSHFMPEIDVNMLDISLFHYPDAPLDNFLQGMEGMGKKVRVFRPVRTLPIGSPPIQVRGDVSVYDVPFLSQYDYDYFLWTCNFNFVRGEDSFVRAQFAAKPFVWNIYVQEKNAHLVKLHAFLDKIRPFYDEASFERLANLHDLWNEGGRIQKDFDGSLWRDGLQFLDGLEFGARKWADYLVSQTDLATQLLTFATHQKMTK